MESYRLLEKNRITAELSSCRTKISRTENANVELKKNSDKEYILAQTAQNTEIISRLNDKIESLEQRLIDLAKGDLDDEIMSTIDTNTTTARKLEHLAHKKKVAIAENDAKNVKLADQYHKKNREIDYQNRVSAFDMQRSYERFCDMDCPPFILDHLKTMPNNRGYIWKGVWYFGRLPPDSDNGECTMFEKQRGDVTIIHQITPTEHALYRKVGKGPKEFLSSKARRPMKRR